MAYAMMAGLPVQVGLYTALVPMVIYAVLGTSRVLSVSTTTTLTILTAAQLGQVVPNGNPALLLRASVTLTLLVGDLQQRGVELVSHMPPGVPSLVKPDPSR